jgi:hypothetical protein
MVSCDVCDARDGVLENDSERAVCRGGVFIKLGTFSGEEGMLSPSPSDADERQGRQEYHMQFCKAQCRRSGSACPQRQWLRE